MLCLLSNCKLPFCSFFVPLLSHVWNFATPWTTALQASLSFTVSLSLLELISFESVMLSNHLILCCHLFLLPLTFPSISVFSSESALCIRCPKYWSFSFRISPSNEHSGLVGSPCSPRESQDSLTSNQRQLWCFGAQHLWCSAFFIVQLSHPYMTTGKTIDLTTQILLAKWCFCSLIYCLGLS